jgi:lipopolysaccharide export system permease protein
MRLFTRYVLGDLCKVFALALFGLTGGMILAFLGQEAMRFGLGPSTVLRLAPYMFPNALRFAIPGTILLTVCCVFGRMSAANEVVAIRALGISPMALVGPALALAFLVSLATVWINDVAITWGRQNVHRVVLESVEKIVYGMLQSQRSYSTKRFAINVKAVDGRRLIRPTIIIQPGEGDPPLTLTARVAELRRNEGDGTLSLLLTEGLVEQGKVRLEFPDTFEHMIPLSHVSKRGELSNSPSECPSSKIRSEIEKQQRQIQALRQSLAADAAYHMVLGEFDSLGDPSWHDRRAQLEGAEHRLRRLQTEPWRRWASGFSCFFFVLLGAPLAIRLRNSDLWTTFGVCFLPILLFYFPLLMLGIDRAKSGAWPPYSVWLGNVVLLAVGLALLRRVISK